MRGWILVVVAVTYGSTSQAVPRTSSCGFAAHGTLIDGVELPPDGLGYQIIEPWRSRKRNFGTRDLVGLIQRAAMRVAIAHPGAVLTVGDLSHRDGGPIAGHQSHQSGRDVDLAYYAVDANGRPFIQDHFLGDFRLDGRADSSIAPRKAHGIQQRFFDAPRNWALIEALITDPHVVVRHIFVSKRVEAWILAEARSRGVPLEMRERARRFMIRPDHVQARNHNDHMHVQIRCSSADARSGACIEGPRNSVKSLEQELGCPRVLPHPVVRALAVCRALETGSEKLTCRRRVLLARECPQAEALIERRRLLDFALSERPTDLCATWFAPQGDSEPSRRESRGRRQTEPR